jgi:type I site-specific restriction endonuclease
MFGKDVKKDDLEQKRFLSRLHRKLTTRWQTNHIFAFRQQHAGREHLESELVTRIGEFNNDEVNCAVAKAWEQYRGKRQRVLCFAVTIEHAETLKKRFFARDDRVRVVHSKMDRMEDRKNLEWFKRAEPESRMLVSVLMLAEGIDLPKTDCLFMVRPTFSPELYQQMIGRGFRGPAADGTEDCAVVDFTHQFVNREGHLRFAQVTTNLDGDVMAEEEGTVPEEDEEPDDLDASGRVWTVRDLKEAVADLQDERGLTIRDACKELAHELDYTARTLINYYYTKPDDYPLGWEDPEADPAEQLDDSNTATGRGSEVNGQHGPAASKGYVTTNKLLNLRAHDPQRFEEIASLTNVASSTLRSYCSDQENFRRWRTNNRDKMDQVLLILAESLTRESDAA